MFNEIINRRATIFVINKIVVDNENVIKITSALGPFGLMPSTAKGVGLKITPNGVIQEEVLTLEMRTIDESFKVVFGVDRIDIIRNKVSVADAFDSTDSFLNKAKEIISTLISLFPISISRLALCANVCYDMESIRLNNIYKIFVNSANEIPVEWQLRKVIRTTLTTNEAAKINNVFTLSRGIVQIGFENVPKDRILLEIDINTMPNAGLLFNEADIENFWKLSVESLQENITKYTALISNE